MERIRVLIVAKKEFADLITSRKFLGFLIIYLLIFGFSTYQGAANFVKSYMEYASHGGEKPHFIDIFGFFATGTISFLGGIFGLIVGFDILTREKETGTLRTLLSHPVFRDEVINGKALAALATVGVVVLISVILVVGIMLIVGFPVDTTDLKQIAVFSVITIAYLFTFFSVGIFSSAVCKTTVNALLMSFALFFVMSFVIPFFSSTVAAVLAGPQPEMPSVEMHVIGNGSYNMTDIQSNPQWSEYEQKSKEWYDRYRAIQDTINILSPFTNYYNLVLSLSQIQYFSSKDTTKNWVGLIVMPILFFSLSYVKFLREEIT